MKRQELLKLFANSGWRILREGANHTILTNGECVEPLPRHKEIQESLAKAIIKKHKLRQARIEVLMPYDGKYLPFSACRHGKANALLLPPHQKWLNICSP